LLAHYFQHVPFEGLGSIEPWLLDNGFEVSCTRCFEAFNSPTPDAIDWLIIMGGPMSVNDEDRYPWLKLEKQFVRTMLAADKPVLGICLGAQMIANVMGASVFANPNKEIGWLPIDGLLPEDNSAFKFLPSEMAFHWHGETFDLPPGAHRLASSPGCQNQAFQIGKRTLGLQFHLEATPLSVAEIVANCRDELIPGPYVQTEKEILSANAQQYNAINQRMADILRYLQKAS
jgi:GMP synthase-like glutamine amidotransferase